MRILIQLIILASGKKRAYYRVAWRNLALSYMNR